MDWGQRKLSILLATAFGGGTALHTGIAYIEIVTDGATGTAVERSGGTEVVNIAAPSAAGVSHNTFHRFSVGPDGAVINNSAVDGVSALAGDLAANPNLATGTARIILNEVTGRRSSQLDGTTELFGDNARYILANPNGLTCDGCGFIRTPTAAGDTGTRLQEVMLTTAVPGADALALGTIRLDVAADNTARLVVGPGGLDASNVDVTTLLTRRASIEGLIDALGGQLRLYAGAGELALAGDGGASWAASGEAAPVAVAIDASALGVMHAGQIFIRATDAGAGVTLPDDLLASGEIAITAAGALVYRDAWSQTGNVAIDAAGGGIVAAGETRAAGDVLLAADGDVQVNATEAGANVSIASRTGRLSAGDTQAGGSIGLRAEGEVRYGTAEARGGDVNIAAAASDAQIRSSGATRAAGDVTLDAGGDTIRLTGTAAELRAGGAINLECGAGEGACRVEADGDLTLDAAWLATQADIFTAAGGALTVQADLDSAREFNSGGRLTLAAKAADLRSTGSLVARDDMTLVSAAGAQIALDGDLATGGDLFLRGAGTYIHDTVGTQQITGSRDIDLYALVNRGTLADLNGGTLRVDRLDNQGLIESQGALLLQVDERLENAGIIASLEGAVEIGHSLPGEATPEIVNAGIIASLDLTHNQLGQGGLILDPSELIAAHTRAILAGEQRSAEDLTREIDAANAALIADLNRDAPVTGVVNIHAGSLVNSDSARISGSDIQLDVGTLDNHGGQINAGRNLAIAGDVLTNRNSASYYGVIGAGDRLDAILGSTLNNYGLITGASVALDAPSLNNLGTSVAGGALGSSIDTAPYLDRLAGQAWFSTADSGAYLNQLRPVYDNALLESDTTRLTQAFLQSSGVTLGPDERIAGDDVYLSELLMTTLREQYGDAFITDDRDGLSQLDTLYRNTRSFMESTGTAFGELPAGVQRDAVQAPVIAFVPQAQSNGSTLYVPRVLMPEGAGGVQEQVARISTQILARDNLFLKGETITTRDADLLAGDNLVIEATDLVVDGRKRDWYVDANGEVKYTTARVEAGKDVIVQLSGNYVQNGAQLIAGNQVAVQADSIRIADAPRTPPRRLTPKAAMPSPAPPVSWSGLMALKAGRAGAPGAATPPSGTRDGALPNVQGGASVSLLARNDMTLTRADIRAGQPGDAAPGSVLLVAEAGSIRQAAGYVGGHSVLMQAGKDIHIESLLSTRQVTSSSGPSRRRWNEGSTRHMVVQRDRVQAEVAEIEAGEGGLVQIAGNDIENRGAALRSAGDLVQQAEGDIVNETLAQRYLAEQVQVRASTWDDHDLVSSSDSSRTVHEVHVQQAELAAGGDIVQHAGGRIRNVGAALRAEGDILQQAGTGIENVTLLASGSEHRSKTTRNYRDSHDDGDYYSRRSRGPVDLNQTTTLRRDVASTLKAGGNIVARVEDGDYLNSGNLRAGGDVVVAARGIRNQRLVVGKGNAARVLDTGRIDANGSILFAAGRDITDIAGRFRAGADILLQAEGDIRQDAIRTTKVTQQIEGLWSSRQTTTTDVTHTAGSFDAGGTVGIDAQGDVTLAGTDIAAQDVFIRGDNVELQALQNSHERDKRHGAREISRTVRHDVVDIASRGDLSIEAGNALTTYGSLLRAGGDEDSLLSLNAGGDMQLLGVNNEDYYYYYKKKKKSFGRSKKTIIESRDVTLAETELSSGGNILVNMGEEGPQDSGRVVLEGTRIDAGENLMVYAGDSLNVLSGYEYSTYRKETHKSGFAGLSKSGSVSREQAQRLGHAAITSGGDTLLLSAGDVNVVAGRIEARNILAEAGHGADGKFDADINIVGEKEALATFNHRYREGLSVRLEDNFLYLAEETHDRRWQTSETYVGSSLRAADSILLKAKNDIHVVGSEIIAGNAFDLEAGANIEVVAGTGESVDHAELTRERLGVEVATDRNGGSAFAGRETATQDNAQRKQLLQASVLQGGSLVRLAAGQEITQRSSDVSSGGDAIYLAGGDILLDSELVYETETHREEIRRDGVSSGIAHNYASTKEAFDNADEGDNGVSKASNALQAIDAIDSFVSGPSVSGFAGTSVSTESNMSSTGTARSSTVSAAGSIIVDAEDNVGMAGAQLLSGADILIDGRNVSVAAKDNRVAQSAESRFERHGVILSADKGTASIGVGGSFSEQDADYVGEGAASSYLAATGNVLINSDTDILVSGSAIEAGGDVTLSAVRDVLLLAQGFDSSYDAQGRSGGAEFGVAATAGADGMALGLYGSGHLGDNELVRDGTSRLNSRIAAGDRLHIQSGRDTVVAGAVAEADDLNMDVGRHLTVASVQDVEQADGRRRDVSGRVVGGVGASVSASVGYGETEGSKAWVSDQTRLIGRSSVTIQVEEHTQIDGALVANIDPAGVDRGNLSLDTGTLGFSNIEDRHKETSYYARIGLTVSGETGSNPQQQHANRQTDLPVRAGQQSDGSGGVGGSLSGYESEVDRRQINRATVGQGSVVIRDGEGVVAGALNRDVARAREVLKDDESTTTFYVSDSSLRSLRGMFTPDDKTAVAKENTFARWGQGLDDYGRNTVRSYWNLEKLGDIENGNAFVDLLGNLAHTYNYTVDGLGLLTLGAVPGAENHGGLFGQVPALLVGDQFYFRVRAPLTTDENGKLVLGPGGYEILGEVERPENDDYVFTNGIQNSVEEAIFNGAMQTGAHEFVLAYNPEHGFLGDGIETLWDMGLGGWVPSGNARDLHGFYKKGIAAGHTINIAAHSQGGLLTYRAIDGLDFTKEGKIESGTLLLSGAPVNAMHFHYATAASGFKYSDIETGENRVVFQQNENARETSFFGYPLTDTVPTLLGWNHDPETDGSVAGSILSVPYLFGSASPHSNYLCQGVTCAPGGAGQPAIEQARPQYIRSTLIEPDGKRIPAL